MASSKDIFEAKIFAADIFAAGVFRGVASSASVFYSCLTAIQAVIQGIGITGLDSANVVVRKVAWVRGEDIPAVIISPLSDPLRRVNNQQIEVGYGCHVVIVRAGNQNLTSGHDTIADWRETIEEALVSNMLSAVSSVVNVTIEPSGLILSEAFRQQYDASAMVVRCVSRETV